jgi:hypothetical protein
MSRQNGGASTARLTRAQLAAHAAAAAAQGRIPGGGAQPSPMWGSSRRHYAWLMDKLAFGPLACSPLASAVLTSQDIRSILAAEVRRRRRACGVVVNAGSGGSREQRQPRCCLLARVCLQRVCAGYAAAAPCSQSAERAMDGGGCYGHYCGYHRHCHYHYHYQYHYHYCLVTVAVRRSFDHEVDVARRDLGVVRARPRCRRGGGGEALRRALQADVDASLHGSGGLALDLRGSRTCLSGPRGGRARLMARLAARLLPRLRAAAPPEQSLYDK